MDFRITMARCNENPPGDMPVFRSRQQESGQECVGARLTQRTDEGLNIAGYGQGLLALRALLLESLAETRLQLLLRNVPKSSQLLLRVSKIYRQRKIVTLFNKPLDGAAFPRPVDTKRNPLLDPHFIRQTIDQLTMRLDDKRHRIFLAFKGQRRFGKSIKRLERPISG